MLEIAKFKADSGEEIQVSNSDVRNVLCPNASDSEIAMFLSLCQAQRLNPFVKDAYLVKYNNAPATIITSKDVFTRRAAHNPKYQGFEAGITIYTKGGQFVRREGSALYKQLGETLLGGWCRVYVEGRKPFYDEVTLNEYSTGKSNWAKMPATMIRKVAIVHCLREAFPDDFQGLYTSEEMEQGINDRPTVTYEVEEEAQYDTAEASDERTAKIMGDVEYFGNLYGKTTAEAMSAVFSSRAALAAGIEAGRKFTNSQADVLDELLAAWICKAEARGMEQKPEPQSAPVDGLEGVQFEEVADDGGDYGEQPTEQPSLYDEDVKF